jgi:anti-sigma regulatory factor (Ser/Thr protein kinase)
MLIEVRESSQTGDARRKALAFAEDLEMGEVRSGDVALAATEIATNLVKHAGRGHILVQRLGNNGSAGVRVIGVDKGPGIRDIGLALADGHSTAGSMGTGLGAVRRLSDSFDVYSQADSGTVVAAEFWRQRQRGLPGRGPRDANERDGHGVALNVGVVSEPIRGEEECGDGWRVRTAVDFVLLMVVDGLGHGGLAAEAAREAERILGEARDDSPLHIMDDTHAALKKTRGAAEAIVKIEAEKRLLSFVGVGNVAASIVAPGSSRSMASYNGTLGQKVERMQEFRCPWNQDSILVMHSDGLVTKWDLERYPGIWTKQPALIAAVLHRDFSRNRDDVTVLVAKAAKP